MTHQDFRYEGTFHGTTGERMDNQPRQTLKTALASPSTSPQDIAYQAALAASKIRQSEADPLLWKPLIEAQPDDLRALVREYLAQHYRVMQQRKKLATVGKQSAAGDEAMAAIAALAKKL